MWIEKIYLIANGEDSTVLKSLSKEGDWAHFPYSGASMTVYNDNTWKNVIEDIA
jgi:hypothetical protein